MNNIELDPLRQLPNVIDNLLNENYPDIFRPLDTFVNNNFPNNLQLQRNRNFKMDFFEKNNIYHIKAELAGVERENINVSITDYTIIISAEKKEEEIAQGDFYHHKELTSGFISRSIKTPENSDLANAYCKYENGILLITVPKLADEDNSSRTIEIN